MISERKRASNRANGRLGGRPSHSEDVAADRLAREMFRRADVRVVRLAAKKLLKAIKAGDFPGPTAPPTETEINQTLSEIEATLPALARPEVVESDSET